MTFDQRDLLADILPALPEQGDSRPTAASSRATSFILQGRDVLAGAQSGTGKVVGFTVPLLQRLAEHRPAAEGAGPRALIVTPTREPAVKFGESVGRCGSRLDLRSAVILDGIEIDSQSVQWHKGVDVLIATLGRLLDHVSQKMLDLSAVEIVVWYETDRMLEMGFAPDIRKISALLPERRQNLMFSVTFPAELRRLADQLLDDPVWVDIVPHNTAAERIVQRVYRVDRGRKAELLAWLIGHHQWRQALVFTRTRHGANRLAQHLQKAGISAVTLHGNKSQSARARALADFDQGGMRVLVATDIACRYLDVDRLPYVVNFELPEVAEHYMHRIGRAGCGREVISLVCSEEEGLLRGIEQLLGHPLDGEEIPGFEPDPTIVPSPTQRRGRRCDRSVKPRRHDRGGAGVTRRRAEGSTGGNRLRKARKPRPVLLDENGDVNGNTLFADNSNRDPVMLAGGYDMPRPKRRSGGKGKARGDVGNGNGRAGGKRRGRSRRRPSTVTR